MRPRCHVMCCAALSAAILSACAGVPPKPQAAAVPTALPLSDLELAGGMWPAKEWWKRYEDPTLDQLIDLALGHSPTLASAHARYDSARQSVRIAGAASGIRVDSSFDANRQRLSDNGLFPPRLLGFNWYNQYDLGLQASYTFDWWGKQRDAIESAMDDAHAAQADRTAAALVLASSVADTYFGWQSDQSRLALAREREALVTREGDITRARVRAQLAPGEDVNRAVSSLAMVREQIAALEGSAKLRVVALAALVGKPAGELPTLEVRRLPAVSGALPDDVRIDLMARRADITASRWRIEAAERGRDAARAEFFPDVSVNGLLGLQSLDIANLVKWGSRVPAVTGAVHLPIFDAGRLKARYGASQAAIDAAVAAYQDTLVTAAREVATQATTLAQIAAQRRERVAAVGAAEALDSGAAARVRQGLVDSRVELGAREDLIAQRDSLLLLDAAAVSADIGLQRALGGGYERTATTP